MYTYKTNYQVLFHLHLPSIILDEIWDTQLFSIICFAGRQRISPVEEISPSSETSRLSVGSGIQSAIDVERMSPDSHQTQGYSLYSPDDMVPVTSSRNHKCRYCNYATTSYTQLQFHLGKHGGKLWLVVQNQ